MNQKPFLLEQDLYDKMIEMNEKNKTIKNWQKKRILGSSFILILGLFFSLFYKNDALIILIICTICSFYIWFISKKSINNLYFKYKFTRQLEFGKFCNLLIPYLEKESKQSLYSILSKISYRVDNISEKKNLNILMKQMSDKPLDVQPFLDFGKKMSDTSFSLIFMTTLFDIKDSNSDPDIIKQLGILADKEVLEKIEDIKEYKLKQFNLFTTRIVFSTTILLLGVGFSFMFYTFSDLFRTLK